MHDLLEQEDGLIRSYAVQHANFEEHRPVRYIDPATALIIASGVSAAGGIASSASRPTGQESVSNPFVFGESGSDRFDPSRATALINALLSTGVPQGVPGIAQSDVGIGSLINSLQGSLQGGLINDITNLRNAAPVPFGQAGDITNAFFDFGAGSPNFDPLLTPEQNRQKFLQGSGSDNFIQALQAGA